MEFSSSSSTAKTPVANLRREFEMQKITESETVKEYSDRLMKVVNQMRLHGEELFDKRVVQKVLVSLPEKFEHKISSLEDSRDLSKVTLTELVNALRAVEQRKTLRLENDSTETALAAAEKGKAQTTGGGRIQYAAKNDNEKQEYHRNSTGAQCKICKQFGHEEKVCKSKPAQAKLAETKDFREEKLCTHHMTPNKAVLKILDSSYSSRVKLGNGEYVAVQGKGTAVVDTPIEVFSMYVKFKAVWLRKMLRDLCHTQEKAIKIPCDNMSAVAIAKNPVFHGRTKHFKIKYYLLREAQEEGEVILVHSSSEDQLADIFTERLRKSRFEMLN
ncbi:hypothetical protein SLEP1_g4069 [Rubroshorea leprosula]|uniref:Retrovirus-related Pol polyprotein from transposon TNT 1-94-like beta-barrel domain-containing protein n=1 Tax=Rubroshorea leprosula TaxID=152421 RepID=A0AAV5HV38_9ROSI|nr:hypothetical protein SLEP1_g4069 [Rubroshorea leprosula]